MLLLIRRFRRVTGLVYHRYLHTRTHIVREHVLRQWSSFPRQVHYGAVIAVSQTWSQISSQLTNSYTHSDPASRGVDALLQCYNQRQGIQIVKYRRSTEGFFTLTPTTGCEWDLNSHGSDILLQLESKHATDWAKSSCKLNHNTTNI
jgi:hypothetical protein